MQLIRPALVLLALLTLLTGVAYPLAVTGIASAVLPNQAGGSLITQNGKVIGSSLIGQNFSGPRYFWPRPSAAGSGYDASASSGSNLGPTSKALVARVESDVSKMREAGVKGPVPADMVTTTASGLDPHISPASAKAQLARVSAARGLSSARVMNLIEVHTDQPFLGIFGAPAVNVLELNLALDAMKMD